MRPRALTIALATIGLTTVFAESPAQSPSLSDSDIRRILADRIDSGQSVGIVVGVIDPAGRRIVSHGSVAKGDTRPVTGDTIFEIGSVTKVFTALLLTDMAGRGEVSLSDPVQQYLPADVRVPQRGGRAITLEDLATHTSGLPRLPTNLAPKNPADPYADYSTGQLYQFLSTYELPRDIGAQYQYSNLGDGLLGFVLARRAGKDYESLVRLRICDPLEMRSTGIVLSPELEARMAPGHDQSLAPVPNWHLPTLAGAGALRADANDLLTFLEAVLGYRSSSLAPAMQAMLRVRRPTGSAGMDISLGWHVLTVRGRDIIWHNGGTGGFRSFLGYEPASRIGVVVLSNTGTPTGVDDIGMHLLDPTLPLRQAPKPHTQVAIDPALLNGYAGRYALAPTFILTVTPENGRLFVQATGQGKLEVFPEGDRNFFYKAVDAQITFEVDGQGRAVALVLHQNGINQRANRID